jgi:hypothetical protein
MNRLRGYLVTGLTSAAAFTGATVGYDHFAGKTAKGVTACAHEYITEPKLLETCDSQIPFSGGRVGMEALGLVSLIGFAGSLGLGLNELRHHEFEEFEPLQRSSET